MSTKNQDRSPTSADIPSFFTTSDVNTQNNSFSDILSSLTIFADNTQKKLFTELKKQAEDGLWMRWITLPEDELSYLKKSHLYTDTQLGKFRHSQRIIKHKLEHKTKSWYKSHKADLNKFAQEESESDDDSDTDTMKGDDYITFVSSTFKFADCKIDDYRYSGQVKQNIGVLMCMPKGMNVPYFLRSKGLTAYTEFVKTSKNDGFHFWNDQYRYYAEEIKNETIEENQKFVKGKHKIYEKSLYMPYNEGLFRYQPKHIRAILLNATPDDLEDFKPASKNALTFYLGILKIIMSSFSVVFCFVPQRKFELQLINIVDMLRCLTMKEIQEFWPDISIEAMREFWPDISIEAMREFWPDISIEAMREFWPDISIEAMRKFWPDISIEAIGNDHENLSSTSTSSSS